MKYPNFNEEKKLWRKGYDFVIGIDEAGRGPLAGPVVAAAVSIKNPNDQIPMTNKITNLKSRKSFGHWTLGLGILEVRDSKKLTAQKREEIFELLKKCPDIKWGIGRVGERAIDRINILEATKIAMVRAVNNLERKLRNEETETRSPLANGERVSSGFLILDGNFRIPSKIPQKSIIKADEHVFSCMCAGIIAKVKRDKTMIGYHKKYPQYGFKKHKGYPTKLHREMIKKYGFCPIHRKTFSC